jgi:PUA domain protein
LKKSLSKREIEPLNAELAQRYGILEFFAKKDRVELFEKDGVRLVLCNGVPAFFERDGVRVPHLKLLLQRPFLKTIAVDRGAIRFVTNGADVMRPGITAFDDGIRKDEMVCVVDAEHRKPLAVGLSQGASDELRAMQKGCAVKNLHWVGDKLWTIEA